MHRIGLGVAAGIVCALCVTGATAQAVDQPPVAAQPQADATPPAQPKPGQEPADALSKALSEVVPLPNEPAPSQLAPRYSFDRVNGAILRLDNVSGRLTLCSQSTAGWVCQAVPEDRAALEKEIGRLQSEVADLKSQVAALREPPAPPRPPADLSPPPSGEPKSALKLPSHEDMERARAAIERAWRRLVDMINDLQRDMAKKG